MSSPSDRLSEKAFYPAPITLDEALKMLVETAERLHYACLSSSSAPTMMSVREDLRNPKPGDIVLEITRHKFEGSMLGRLLFVAGRAPRTNGEWEEALAAGYWKMPPPARSNGPYWYVDPLDGSQRARWEDCQFIKIPTSPADLLL